MDNKLQVDFEDEHVCRRCGARDADRVYCTRIVKGQRRRYWVCRKCGAHGVRVVIRNA